MSGESGGGGGAGERDPVRLVDGGASAEAGWAVDLLRSAEPYQAPAGRKQRVRLSLGQVPRRAPALLRPLVVGLVLMSLGAIASAELGPALPRWVGQAVDRVVAVVHPHRPQALSPSRPATHAVRVASVSQPVVSPPIPAEVPPAIPPVGPAPAARIRHVARPSAAEDETALLLEAMRALRRQGDPARARVLLTRYLQQHPTGALAEEALAMSIEAAVAAHDADAPALARRYLRSYPRGPFRAVATQALSQPRSAD